MHMPRRLPSHLPPFSALADDIPCSRAVLACTLDVTPKTLARWIDEDCAPRTARLAVFWLTRWGESVLDADLYNANALHAAQARELRVELIKAQRQIARLRRALDAASISSANSPVYSGEPLPLIEAGNC